MMVCEKRFQNQRFQNRRFQNPNFEGIRFGFLQILLWKLGFKREASIKPPSNFCFDFERKDHDLSKPYFIWINHSTFLIHLDNHFFLTDPIFSRSCSPLQIIGPYRKHRPAIDLNEIPKIDYVLISHNHYDHLDKSSVLKLNKINPNTKWIVPLGVKKWFLKNNIENVYEMDWWQSLKISKFVFHAVPAQHFSGRILLDYNSSLWAGFVVESIDKSFYFAGDTGYNDRDFKEIGQRWKKIDLAMIPVGGYIPRAVIGKVHVDPYQAVQIHKDVNSRFSVGMHFKTFKLSDEHFDLPPYDLYLAKKRENLPNDSFVTVRPGQYVNW